MSAEWRTQAATSWKLSLPVSRALAERLAALDDEAGPVLVVSEPDPARPDDWRLDAYFEGVPTPEALDALAALCGPLPAAERIADADWVTMSQAWLEPIRAGRFHVHTAAYADDVPADAIPFRIEASRAFGTGHHETTSGCLEMLSTLADEGRTFDRVADIGTGTGLLAFAAHALWPRAAVVATDIDPVAIPVIEENMSANGIGARSITVAVADGTAHPALRAGDFDLVIANILAEPLIQLAPDLVAILRPGGFLQLAGLLGTQERDVASAYAALGLAVERRLVRGDWTILLLRRP